MKPTRDPKAKKMPAAPKQITMPGKVKPSMSDSHHMKFADSADHMPKSSAKDIHPDGHKVLSSHAAHTIHDGDEMKNAYGVNEKQEKSEEDHTVISDKKAMTGNKAKMKNGKGY